MVFANQWTYRSCIFVCCPYYFDQCSFSLALRLALRISGLLVQDRSPCPKAFQCSCHAIDAGIKLRDSQKSGRKIIKPRINTGKEKKTREETVLVHESEHMIQITTWYHISYRISKSETPATSITCDNNSNMDISKIHNLASPVSAISTGINSLPFPSFLFSLSLPFFSSSCCPDFDDVQQVLKQFNIDHHGKSILISLPFINFLFSFPYHLVLVCTYILTFYLAFVCGSVVSWLRWVCFLLYSWEDPIGLTPPVCRTT